MNQFLDNPIYYSFLFVLFLVGTVICCMVGGTMIQNMRKKKSNEVHHINRYGERDNSIEFENNLPQYELNLDNAIGDEIDDSYLQRQAMFYAQSMRNEIDVREDYNEAEMNNRDELQMKLNEDHKKEEVYQSDDDDNIILQDDGEY